jgi:hypothetical protein
LRQKRNRYPPSISAKSSQEWVSVEPTPSRVNLKPKASPMKTSPINRAIIQDMRANGGAVVGLIDVLLNAHGWLLSIRRFGRE